MVLRSCIASAGELIMSVRYEKAMPPSPRDKLASDDMTSFSRSACSAAYLAESPSIIVRTLSTFRIIRSCSSRGGSGIAMFLRTAKGGIFFIAVPIALSILVVIA
ncbi:hypothetical protein D3C85_1389950 [compost metagenome]